MQSHKIEQFSVTFERYVLNGKVVTRMMEDGFPHPLLVWSDEPAFAFDPPTLHAIASAYHAGVAQAHPSH
jgi:hypothetical protein